MDGSRGLLILGGVFKITKLTILVAEKLETKGML